MDSFTHHQTHQDLIAFASGPEPVVYLGIAVILVLAGIFVVWLWFRFHHSRPMRTLVGVAERLSVGKAIIRGEDLTAFGTILARRDEIGAVGRAFHALASYQIQIERAAEAVMEGKLRLELRARNNEDLLGNTFLEMVDRLRIILKGVQENAARLDDAARRLDEDSTQTGTVTGQIAATIQHVAETASAQTNEISRAVSALEEITRASADVRSRSADQAQAIAGAVQAMQTLSEALEQIQAGAGMQTEFITRNRQALDDLTRASQRIMNGARTQNQGMEQAGIRFGNLLDVIRTFTDFIRETSRATDQTAGQAHAGMQLMEMTTHSMEEVHQDTSSLAASIQELNQRTEQISDITATIKDIAGQTNMIALNAAIEAARSGTQSKAIAEDLLGWQILIQCHLLADLLESEESAGWNASRWESLCKRAGLDTFLATDADGVVTITNQPEIMGWRFPDDPKEQAFVFRQLISRKDGVIVQKFQKRSFDDKTFKWVGISRRDQPGIIQVGMNYEISRLAEHSGGFSVLAQEVRKLAEKAASASAEISRIIQTVQTSARDTVAAMQKAGSDIGAAEELSMRAREAFQKIADGTQESAQRARSVQDAIAEMEAASAVVNDAIASAQTIARDNQDAAAEMGTLNAASLALVEQIEKITAEHAQTVAGLKALNMQLARMLEDISHTAQDNESAVGSMAQELEAVRENIEILARLSEENSASAEEVSASTEELSAQAEEIVGASHDLTEMSRSLHRSVENFEL